MTWTQITITNHPTWVLILALLVTGTLSLAQLPDVLAEEFSIRLQDATRAKCNKVLRQAIDSDEFWPSMHAAEAMTLAGAGEEVRQRLVPRLEKEEDDQRRCGLARELVRAGDRERVAVLVEILAGKETYGHVHACESLYKVSEVGDKQLLLQAMRQTEDAIKALMAAAALGRAGNSEALSLVRKQLRHDDPKTARIAAWILARLGTADDIPLLNAETKRMKEPLDRVMFDHALAALGDQAGLQTLTRNLSHTDSQIRALAATFAADARATFVHKQLAELLEDEDLDVQVRAAQSLLMLSVTFQPSESE